MNIRTMLFCGALGLTLVTGSAAAQNLALAPGDQAPPLIVWDLDNEYLTIAWQGTTLVNFWATWCKPCREEMPVLQELHSRYADDGFRVIGMTKDIDVSIEEVQSFIEELEIDYPIYKPDRMARWEFVLVVPTSFLIDAEGKVIRKYVGATPAQIEGLKQDVDNLLNGRPMDPLVMPEPDAVSTKN